MRRRILATTLGISAAAVLLFAIPLAVVIGRLLDEQGALRLPPRISVSHHLIVRWYQNATGLQWSG